MAKMTAWILCIVSVLGSVGFGICLLIGVEGNLFSQTRDEVRREAYEYVNWMYSIEAYASRGSSTNAQRLRENYFQYGIVNAESLKGINFHDRQAYLDTNMTDEELAAIDPDQLFLCIMAEEEDGSFSKRNYGYYGSYDDIASLDAVNREWIEDNRWTYLYADRICFDVAKGIIYYRAEGNYYPVQNVSLCYEDSDEKTVYNYNYDFISQGYQLNYEKQGESAAWENALLQDFASDGTAVAEAEAEVPEDEILQEAEDGGEAAEEAEAPEAEEEEEVPGAENRIQDILRGDKGTGSIVNLAKLNDTAFDYSNWGMILLDNIRLIRGEELTIIDSGSMEDSCFIRESGYYLNEDYTLVVRENIQPELYWVVSVVPKEVPADLTYNKYIQESWFVDLFYDVMDSGTVNVFQGLGISILLMVLTFVFLVSAAGHRKGVDGVVLTLFDRIPFDILTVAVLAVEACFLVLGLLGLDTQIFQSAYACIGLYSLLGSIMTTSAILYALSFCVRVKAGKWWRNSVCYWVYSKIRDFVRSIFRNMGLLWKVILILGILSFLEFSVMMCFDMGTIVLFWLIEKAVVCAVLCMLVIQIHELQKAGHRMAEGDLSYKIDTARMLWECKKHGENLNKIGEGMSKAVDERMKSERLKTELITNVSHDIKTPLTSIINYVDLLSKEELHNDRAAEYLEVLDRQSSKLKKLIEDLVEASKASSGNLAVDSQQLEAGVFLTQTVGEFEEKLLAAGLELIVSKPQEPVYIMADGRHIWRVIDNLMNNVCKYAQEGSRVYVNLEADRLQVCITFRNISKYPLNISSEELTERFVRGDKSRNTEGHGLGLSIAQSLMNLIGGQMHIVVDGDLFKAVLMFERYEPVTVAEKEVVES